jgi:hypothetical protein
MSFGSLLEYSRFQTFSVCLSLNDFIIASIVTYHVSNVNHHYNIEVMRRGDQRIVRSLEPGPNERFNLRNRPEKVAPISSRTAQKDRSAIA